MADTIDDEAIILPDGDELIPDAALAAEWKTTQRSLRRYENEPNGLPYLMLGGRKWRPRKACGAWLASRVKMPNPRRKAA